MKGIYGGGLLYIPIYSFRYGESSELGDAVKTITNSFNSKNDLREVGYIFFFFAI